MKKNLKVAYVGLTHLGLNYIAASSEKGFEIVGVDINQNKIDKLNQFKADYQFHLGGHTDLEYCEKNIEDTYLSNTISVENATIIANNLDIPIFYVSTAGIFDGKKDLYDEWDEPKPIGHYANSKYAGEIFIQNNAKKYLNFDTFLAQEH